MRDVMPCRLSLQHGDVHDLVQSGAIARGVNVWNARLHLRVGDDAAEFQLHTNFIEGEPCYIWHAPKAKEDLFRMCAARFAFVLEKDFLLSAKPSRLRQFRVSVNRHTLASESILNHLRGVRIHFVKHMRAALNQRELHTETREELSEFQRHRSTAKHYERARQLG